MPSSVPSQGCWGMTWGHGWKVRCVTTALSPWSIGVVAPKRKEPLTVGLSQHPPARDTSTPEAPGPQPCHAGASLKLGTSHHSLLLTTHDPTEKP